MWVGPLHIQMRACWWLFVVSIFRQLAWFGDLWPPEFLTRRSVSILLQFFFLSYLSLLLLLLVWYCGCAPDVTMLVAP